VILAIDGDPADLPHDPVVGQLLGPIGVNFVGRLTLRSGGCVNRERKEECGEQQSLGHFHLGGYFR
jgi:hypothetical protein